jgi:hypothetical protein
LFIPGLGSKGVGEYEASNGKYLETFATSLHVEAVGIDDAGDAFTFSGGTGTSSPPPAVKKVAIGGNKVLASYAPTSYEKVFLFASPQGEVVVLGYNKNTTAAIFDVWDAGATGKPSRTLTYTAPKGGLPELDLGMAADGTLYIPYNDGTQKFDVIPPGTATPSRTIVDTLAPSETAYTPNWLAIGSNGTLYCGEWGFYSGDPDAGLYVYPKSGAQKLVTSMDPGINGLDTDAAGNVYLISDNAAYDPSTGKLGDDTAEQMSEYTPNATKLVRQFDDGVPGVLSLTVGNNGAAYLVQFGDDASNGPTNSGNIYRVPSGSSKVSLLIQNRAATNVILYDGTNSKDASPQVVRASLGGASQPAFMGRFVR